jgi:tripeptidyl-peptidase I
LSVEQVNDLVKPAEKSSELVLNWLHGHGISSQDVRFSPAGDWIKLALSVRQLEDLLNTKYAVYERDDGTEIIRTEKWSLPDYLHDHIAVIHPTNSFFHDDRPQTASRSIDSRRDMTAMSKQATNGTHITDPVLAAACKSTYLTPECLGTLYGTVNYTVQAADRNSMAINSFLSDPANRSDASIFLQQYRREAISGAKDLSQVSINGGIITQKPNTPQQLKNRRGQESALDVQTMLGLAWPTPLTVYETAGGVPNLHDPYTDFFGMRETDPYVAWLQFLLAQPSLPNVLSVSWGASESSIPQAQAVRICQMFAQLGARGTSVFFATGDMGVGPSGGCTWKNGTKDFVRAFPATCPFVTSVGGTKGFEPEGKLTFHAANMH